MLFRSMKLIDYIPEFDVERQKRADAKLEETTGKPAEKYRLYTEEELTSIEEKGYLPKA